MITAMAKFRVWARSTYAKVRARFYSTFRTVAQFFARLWSFLLTHWKWGAGAVAVLGVVLVYGGIVPLPTIPNISHIAQMLGYTATVVETAEENGVMVTVRTTSTSSPEGRFVREAIIALTTLVALGIAGWRSYAFFRQYKTAEDRLLNERFTAASELMAKENNFGNPAIAARISGMYIMGKLAKEAAKEFAEQVVVNLIAYIKEHAQKTAKEQKDKMVRMLGEDVKVAFAVLHDILSINEIKARIDETLLDFSHQNFSRLILDASQIKLEHYNNWTGTDFRWANLSGAVFNNKAIMAGAKFNFAVLNNARLEGVNLQYAEMENAFILQAKMQRVDLFGADLNSAVLVGAYLQGANLSMATLQGADLTDAQLNETNDKKPTILERAHLEGANLDDTNLSGANLCGAYLQGAFFGAVLCDTYLLGAKFDSTYMSKSTNKGGELPEKVKAAMNGRIWHSGASWASGIHERSLGASWNLEQYKNNHALGGVLRNFANASAFDVLVPEWVVGAGEESKNIRLQARELLDTKKWPQDAVTVPWDWREWLRELNPLTGGHPTDNLLV